ncbi:hypothetical protein OROHE_016031 [Orobanche hederae]
MAYHDSIVARSFSQDEMKKLGCVALIICFVIAGSICNIFKEPVRKCVVVYYSSISIKDGPLLVEVNLEGSLSLGLKILIGSQKPQQRYSHIADDLKPISNLSNSQSDVLEMSGDIRIHGRSSTIYVASACLEKDPAPPPPPPPLPSWTLKPYARKGDTFVMNYVRKWKIKYEAVTTLPNCIVRSTPDTTTTTVPAVVFSTGGYTGNQFHDFTDVLIPLYLTSRPFNGSVVFLVTDIRYSWTSKYRLILQKLSDYDVVNIDKVNEVTCFSRMTFGLKSHKELGLHPWEFPYYSIMDFRQFLRDTYSLNVTCRPSYGTRRPRLLMISRKNSRCLKNEQQVADTARFLGFDVVVSEIVHNVSVVASFVNSFDVMMGVHGAGLTNMVFLPDEAVVIEIIPFGLDLLAKDYFQSPAREMGMSYLEYKVDLNESSLLGKYPHDSEVYTHPGKLQKKGFLGFRSLYLDNQDINLNCVRFRETLLEALRIIDN